MAIEYSALKETLGDNPSMEPTLAAISPYLPVLKRLGKAGLDVFVDGVRNQDWSRIDRELYAEMTEDERDALSAQVLQDARAAVKAAHEADRQWNQDLLRLTLAIVLSFI
jgi:hypothetical protein